MSLQNKNQVVTAILSLLQRQESESSSDSDSSTEEYLISVTTTLSRLSENLTQDYSTEQFLHLYRIHPKLFQTLAAKFEVSPYFRRKPEHGGGRPAIPPSKQVLIFLWYAGQRHATCKTISKHFDISLDRSCQVLHKLSAFLGTMSSEAITWQTRQEKEEACRVYSERTSGIPNIIGAMDQIHIAVTASKTDSELYLNAQKFHSVHLQAICDQQLKFLDVFVGYPGSVEPAQVLKNSFIYSKLPKLCKDTCLVGSVSYEVTPWCLVPYKETELSSAQQNFNYSLNSVLCDVHQTFDILKERFPCLHYIFLRDMQTACELIMGCCILHNLSDNSELQTLRGHNSNSTEVDDGMNEDSFERAIAAGKELRDSLAVKLLNVRTSRNS